jgi:thymidylate kinase
MAYKVTFSGIDGSGRSTVIDNISRRFSSLGISTMHPYRPSFADFPVRGRQYFHVGLNGAMDEAHRFLDDHNQRCLVGLLNMGFGIVRVRIENRAIRRFDPDLVMVSRHPILDPSVYSTYYFPWSGKWSPERRMRVAQVFNNAIPPDLHLYMNLDPELAYQRILKRIESDKRTGNQHRQKWNHMHENPTDLKFLQERFEETLDILAHDSGRKIVRIDASKTKEEVAEVVFQHIRKGLVS